MDNNPKKKVSNIMLIISCVMIVFYAAADFILQYYTSVEVSPTLTDKWFFFWSSEIFLLAGIKVSKILKGVDKKEEITEEENINKKE